MELVRDGLEFRAVQHHMKVTGCSLVEARRDVSRAIANVRSRGAAKLTDEEAEEVRDLYKAGWTYRRIAEKFGVSHMVPAGIVQGKYYGGEPLKARPAGIPCARPPGRVMGHALLLEFVREHPGLTTAQIAKETCLNPSSIRGWMSRLKASNKVRGRKIVQPVAHTLHLQDGQKQTVISRRPVTLWYPVEG